MLYDYLVSLHQKMQDPANWATYGLCTSFYDLDPPAGVSYEFQKLMQEWPKHSGETSYPIKDPDGKDSPWEMYERHVGSPIEEEVDHMWNREVSAYAAARWELLEWMIEETKP